MVYDRTGRSYNQTEYRVDQRQIERFIDVAETGSLSRSSRRMHVSQPALSKSLRTLEDQVGAQLLNRGPRGVRLTEFGTVFYQRARSIAAEFRRAAEELGNLRGSTAGAIAIGVTPGPGVLDRVVPKAVSRVARRRPGLKVQIRSGTLSELLPALNAGDLDVLFTVLDERVAGPDLHCRKVFDDHFALVARPAHPLFARRRIALRDLLAYRWALLEDAVPLWHVLEGIASELGIAIQFAPIESNSVIFMRTVVGENDFVGVLPSYAAALSSELGFLPLERMAESGVLPRLNRPMGLIHRAETTLTPVGRAILRSIAAVCQELGLNQAGA
jgi:DNA-binding transcriptional LysR family regulator